VSQRTEDALRWTGKTATCRNCETDYPFNDLQLRRGDAENAIEFTPCHNDGCTVMLCPNCPQFQCEGCDLTHCQEHAVKLSDGPWCPACVRGLLADGELLATEEDAAVVATIAAAGCSADQARAFGKGLVN
jgi:hypothetical protein